MERRKRKSILSANDIMETSSQEGIQSKSTNLIEHSLPSPLSPPSSPSYVEDEEEDFMCSSQTLKDDKPLTQSSTNKINSGFSKRIFDSPSLSKTVELTQSELQNLPSNSFSSNLPTPSLSHESSEILSSSSLTPPEGVEFGSPCESLSASSSSSSSCGSSSFHQSTFPHFLVPTSNSPDPSGSSPKRQKLSRPRRLFDNNDNSQSPYLENEYLSVRTNISYPNPPKPEPEGKSHKIFPTDSSFIPSFTVSQLPPSSINSNPISPNSSIKPPPSPRKVSASPRTQVISPVNVNPYSSPDLRNQKLKASLNLPLNSPLPFNGNADLNKFYATYFEEEEIIGKGSYGEVAKSKSKIDGWLYAVKKVPITKINKYSEVYALAALDAHQNIVRYHIAWKESSSLFILMEYCDQGSLADVVKRKTVKFDETQLLDILSQVTMGVHHIHSRDLVHLDIKPENIYVKSGHSQNSTIYKIGDFGLSRSFLNKDTEDGDSRYIPLELLELDQSNVDKTKADIFSLGCSILELTRDSPLPKGDKEFHEIRRGNFSMSPRFSQSFVSLVRLMLHKTPERRPTARDILQNPLIIQINNQRNFSFTYSHLEQRLNKIESMLSFIYQKLETNNK